MSIQAASASSPLARVQSFSPSLAAQATDSESSSATTSPTYSFQASEGLESDGEGAAPASPGALSGLVDAPFQTAANTVGPNDLNPSYPIQTLAPGRCVGTLGSGFAAKPAYVPCPKG